MYFSSFFHRYPWGQEAFDKAKSEDKPIFLSGNTMVYLKTYWMGGPSSITLSYYCLQWVIPPVTGAM